MNIRDQVILFALKGMFDKGEELDIDTIGKIYHALGMKDVRIVLVDKSVFAQDKALEELLKREDRVCWTCGGTGSSIVIADLEIQCIVCDGIGRICAWCLRSENTCNCGSEE